MPSHNNIQDDTIQATLPSNETNVTNGTSELKGLALIQSKASSYKDLEGRYNMKMVYKNFLASGMHTFLYGPSGSMKSTIVASIMLNKAFATEYKVHYWAFDTDPAFNMAFSKIATERKLTDNIMFIEDVTPADFHDGYKSVIDAKENLQNTVIVVDTYKFIASADVNDKKTNAKTMHFIKELCKLGACVVSLGHTNKDGKKNSGTAEMEQDSDAIMRIDAIDQDGSKIATIKKAGRIRFAYHTPITFKTATDQEQSEDMEQRSYDLISGIESQADFMDVESLVIATQMSEQDTELIELIQNTIATHTEPQKLTQLVEEIHGSDMNSGHSKKTITQKLHAYKGREWYFHKNPHSKKGILVSLSDNIQELVDSINESIQLAKPSEKNKNDVF